MNRITKITLQLAMVACAILALAGVAYAAPPLPATFYGTAKINGANVPIGTAVEATIGGVVYATTAAKLSGPDTVYVIDVPGDVAEIAGKQGGVEGETIQFRIGGLVCPTTDTWHMGTLTNLNLNATGSLPTTTPTMTPTATSTPTATPQVTSTPQVIDLKPGNAVIRDTYLDSWHLDDNFGNDWRLRVRTISGIQYRPLIYFDLSTIPVGSTIRSATLYLRLDNYSHQPDQSPRVSIYKVKQDWAELEANWNKRTATDSWATPGCESVADRDLTESSYQIITSISTTYDWNVTALVQGWVSTPGSNRGMVLISDIGRELRFYSSNDTDIRYQPHLTIEFIAGGPVVTATPTQTSATPVVTPSPVEIRGASQDTYIDLYFPKKNYENKGLVVRGNGIKRPLLKFDIGSIPLGARITSATLRLTATNYDDGKSWLSLNVGAYLVNRAWLANQATWEQATNDIPWAQIGCDAVPADRQGTPASSTVVQAISGTRPAEMVYYDWDVTSIVQAWADNPGTYAGLALIALDNNLREMSFYDSAYSMVEHRPLLSFTWSPATPTPSPTPQSTPTVPPGKGAVAGTVFNDLNANGRIDGGEPGLSGVQVHLWQSGVLVSSQASDGSGGYRFNGINPGWYTVREVDPPGYVSPPSSGNDVYVQVLSGFVATVNFGDYNAAVVTPPPAVRLPILVRF